MQLYLPIAELSVNSLLIFGMGLAVGIISGLFGVGGGFLLTPLLVFSGIPPAVAVATVTSQIVASSASGAITYWRRQSVDWKLAACLLVGGILGSLAGVQVFRWLKAIGQLDLIIGVCYVLFLGSVGLLMVLESLRVMLWGDRPAPADGATAAVSWTARLPLRMAFPRSGITVSLLPLMALGIFIGFLGSLLGIGGGFLTVPALIYLLKIPTGIVIGTSMVQMVVTMSFATVLQAVSNHAVDIVLALLLMCGGVIGAQIGTGIGTNLRGEHLRGLFGLLILCVGIRFAYDLVVEPADPISLTIESTRLPGAPR